MNIKFLVSSALAIVLLAGCATEIHKHQDKEAKLQAEAASNQAHANVRVFDCSFRGDPAHTTPTAAAWD
jgi:outer membrane biogenesis lipoprotein LolB